ncbi:pectinesterase family protein [Saccharibacillus sp. CPCC 101409]|uniref:pectinesterase family protein n=1 Tax=Saccharibacillus sp. CPCC 101409 TaxID=3058041 RepID=UPI002672FDC6|nr:pectinesterase family protein [Saccharibacillus sp. CPCC 101409]MDO3409680.1 pectinesterase family protein [Saccharibacillus sp. CPCC 101409]
MTVAKRVGLEPGCDYVTIQSAVDALEREGLREKPAALYILSGTYREQVRIYRSNLRMVGIGAVTIVMNRCARERGADGEEIGTFATPTLFLGGADLELENLTIVNDAGQGESIGQAVALAAHCDRAVFRNCILRGHQDTLFTGPLPPSTKTGGAFGGIPIREHHAQYRQLYDRCRIEGTVDYIFGGATTVFDRCRLHSVVPDRKRSGYITAASTPQEREYGYVFRSCDLTADPGVPAASVYLGRPWRPYAQTCLIDCRIGDHIHPAGWHNWNNADNERTADYREYGQEAAKHSADRAAWTLCQTEIPKGWDNASIFGEDWNPDKIKARSEGAEREV